MTASWLTPFGLAKIVLAEYQSVRKQLQQLRCTPTEPAKLPGFTGTQSRATCSKCGCDATSCTDWGCLDQGESMAPTRLQPHGDDAHTCHTHYERGGLR